MADLDKISEDVTKLIIHVQNIKETIVDNEQERKDSKDKFWGKIDEMRVEIGAIKTEMSTMKIKVGAVVIVVSSLITGVINWALRHMK